MSYNAWAVWSYGDAYDRFSSFSHISSHVLVFVFDQIPNLLVGGDDGPIKVDALSTSQLHWFDGENNVHVSMCI